MGKVKSLKAQKVTKPRTSKQKPVATASHDFDEAAIIKKLADNERSVREKALKALSGFLSGRRSIDEFKLQKLWKGLFFTMWHSDRPLTQQALAQELADLSKTVNDVNYWKFINAFWLIMCREWTTIDKHRINKFYMLLRFYYAAMLQRLGAKQWDAEELSQYTKCLETSALEPRDPKFPHAVRIHMCDIILDEIEKVRENDQELPVAELVAPLLSFVEQTSFKTVKLYAISDVLKDPRLQEWGYESKWTPQPVEEELDSDNNFESEEESVDEDEDEVEEDEFTGFD